MFWHLHTLYQFHVFGTVHHCDHCRVLVKAVVAVVTELVLGTAKRAFTGQRLIVISEKADYTVDCLVVLKAFLSG